MPLNDIVSKIIDDAKGEAEIINNQTETEIEKIDRETKSLVAKTEKKDQTKLAELIELETKRYLAGINGENQREIENSKRKALDKTFKLAEEILLKTDGAELENLCLRLMKQLPTGEITAIKTGAKELPTLEKIAKGMNLNCTVTIDKNITGGFVAESEDSEYNFTWKSLINTAKTNLETKVAEALF